MAWGDITLETTTWVDITDAAIFLTDQNGDIMYTQDGNPIMASGSTSVEWTDINIPTLYVTDQNGDIVTDQDGTPMTVQDGTYSLNEWTDI